MVTDIQKSKIQFVDEHKENFTIEDNKVKFDIFKTGDFVEIELRTVTPSTDIKYSPNKVSFVVLVNTTTNYGFTTKEYNQDESFSTYIFQKYGRGFVSTENIHALHPDTFAVGDAVKITLESKV